MTTGEIIFYMFIMLIVGAGIAFIGTSLGACIALGTCVIS